MGALEFHIWGAQAADLRASRPAHLRPRPRRRAAVASASPRGAPAGARAAGARCGLQQLRQDARAARACTWWCRSQPAHDWDDGQGVLARRSPTASSASRAGTSTSPTMSQGRGAGKHLHRLPAQRSRRHLRGGLLDPRAAPVRPSRCRSPGTSSAHESGADYDVARTLARVARLRRDPWAGIEDVRREQRLPHPS